MDQDLLYLSANLHTAITPRHCCVFHLNHLADHPLKFLLRFTLT